MGPLESAVVGFLLVAAGLGLMAWDVRHHRAWERGEVPPPEDSRSFHAARSAPDGNRIAFGVALIFVGAIILAPFVASL